MTEIEKIPILLVDDRPENLTALEALLEDLGLDIFKATSGNEALSLSLKHDFSIVLLDVRMPDMDGFETAELMRANPKTSRLPIIFVTAAMKESEHQFKGYEAGAFDYLLKPIEPTILRSKIMVFCELYQQRRKIEMHEQQLETVVRERTAELNDSNDQLQLELEERKWAEEALRQSEEKYRSLYEECFDCLFITSPAGKILDMNKTGVMMFGYNTKEEILHLDLERDVYVLPEDREWILSMVNAKGSAEYEVTVKKKNGEQMITFCSLTAVRDEKGVTTSYRGIIRDITEHKRAEEEILKLNEELEQRVKDRTKELERRNYELEQMNKAFVGRELRMAELKERIAELEKAGRE